MATTIEKPKEKFDIGKLVRGFLPTGPNLGKMLWTAVISTIVCGAIIIGMKVMQQTGNTEQTAEEIVNIKTTQGGFRVFGIELLSWRK